MPHSNFPFALRVFSSVCKGSLNCSLGFKDLSCSEHYMLQMIVISEWLCKSTMTLFDVLHADFLQEKKRKPKENKEKNPYQTSNFNRGSVRYFLMDININDFNTFASHKSPVLEELCWFKFSFRNIVLEKGPNSSSFSFTCMSVCAFFMSGPLLPLQLYCHFLEVQAGLFHWSKLLYERSWESSHKKSFEWILIKAKR